ncbi:MAG: glycosyltransferase family 2 protein [Proteobacteria bacterium]|nr:glycosyltransferase family 2 protein [Pseudomonadota bacterium]
MTNTDQLSILIPAFNEELNIERTLTELRQQFADAEIIVVDDGSTDDTASIASRMAGVTLVQHSHNTGYGSALKTAFRRSTRAVVAWYDADGQHRPEDLRAVVQPVLNGEKDAVIGVRGEESDVVTTRVPGKRLLKYCAQIVARAPVPDLNSGLRAFRAEVLKRYLHLLPQGFSASSTTTLILMRRGYRLGYAPIQTKARKGTSTVKIFRDGWRTLQIILRLFVLFDALNFFTALAAVQAIPSLVYGTIIALIRDQGFPVLASTFFISGLLTFFMGVVCDQIVALRKERFEH